MTDIFNWLTDNKTRLMNKVIYKMIPNIRDAEDFYQDLYVIVAGKDEAKMNRIFQDGELGAYMYIVIKNNLESVNSRYYYTYRKPIGFEYDENKDSREIQSSEDNEIMLQEIEKDWSDLRSLINYEVSKFSDVNPKAFIRKNLFDLFFLHDLSYRQISAKLGIPTTTVFNYVTETKNIIFPKFIEETESLKKKITVYNSVTT